MASSAMRWVRASKTKQRITIWSIQNSPLLNYKWLPWAIENFYSEGLGKIKTCHDKIYKLLGFLHSCKSCHLLKKNPMKYIWIQGLTVVPRRPYDSTMRFCHRSQLGIASFLTEVFYALLLLMVEKTAFSAIWAQSLDGKTRIMHSLIFSL